MKKTIWGNTIVCNEDKYLWFAVKSVIDYLDRIIIWDTGSTDNTVEVIKLLQKEYPDKISFSEIGIVDPEGLARARQQMLEETRSDWIFILDGDEVWWKESIGEIIKAINEAEDKIDLIVNPYYSVVGDIYHYQEEGAGRYNLAGRTGHLNIRAMNRKIPGLHLMGAYPLESFCDESGKRIQERDQEKIAFIKASYLHFSNINRSTFKRGDEKAIKREKKIRHEIGIKFPANFHYPEVLYLEHPQIVPSPWQKMSIGYKLRSYIETPLRKIKRRIK